jgi:tRNA-uridine 2-sulfurtransferase
MMGAHMVDETQHTAGAGSGSAASTNSHTRADSSAATALETVNASVRASVRASNAARRNAVAAALERGDCDDPANRMVVAMSGGVDSSAVAWMLKERGHPLVGLFMRNGVKVSEAEAAKKSCCSLGDARDARMVAARLDVPFQAVDLAREFKHIIRYFVDEYRAGRTPNPCAVCNRDLKFDRLLELADELGAVGVATGHYARIDVEDGRVHVRRGVDERKDQSYQLFAVSEPHLARTRLPLGALTKPRVREIAEAAGLRTAKKPDSQEICFVPGNDYRALLAEQGVELTPGRMVDTGGNVLRQHEGVEHYTIGQRRGHGVGGRVEPLYVVDLEPSTGTVVLGSREECTTLEAHVDQLNWIGVDAPEGGRLQCEVQIRYHHDAAPAELRIENGIAQVRFAEPQLAVTPGQGAAFYLGERLIGGGWLRRAPDGAASVGAADGASAGTNGRGAGSR